MLNLENFNLTICSIKIELKYGISLTKTFYFMYIVYNVLCIQCTHIMSFNIPPLNTQINNLFIAVRSSRK